ncbi:MAG: lipoyl(octanoyl) transferase [Betaproteobacteria bacterium]|nr:lipoyl(octanoyl) transferase [Betaproteobacteria bacterium]
MLANQIADVLTKPRYVPAHDLDRKIAGKLQKLISVWHRQFTRLGLKAFPGASSHRWLGAAIVYVLLNLARRELMVRQLVSLLEQSCIDLLKSWGIDSQRRSQAPGVYLAAGSGSDEALSGRIENSIKIAALGLKVSRSCSYHGLALNVAMDLSPFSRIDPCGYPGLAVTDMKSCLGYAPDFGQVQAQLAASITASLQAHDREQTTPYEQQP